MRMGKLAAEILMQNWDIALEELNRLKEIIDSKVVLVCQLVFGVDACSCLLCLKYLI